jgi:hypothetical protein
LRITAGGNIVIGSFSENPIVANDIRMRKTVSLPELQIEFSVALAEIRRLYLQDALRDTVRNIDIVSLDQEIGKFVPPSGLKIMAAHSLRAELMFPVPLLLKANPRLLGYYRLLYGFSQKAFYTAETGIGPFKPMEVRGIIPAGRTGSLPSLCKALIRCGHALLQGIGQTRISCDLLDDLTLLTVGPQLRGGANVKKGAVGIVQVFEAIYKIVKTATVSFNESQITVKNAAGRTVYVEFAPDPDIVIREEIAPASFAEKIAIEVKAGKDFSNVHNRIGEAEKSHQKARSRGFVECWTVLNVARLDTAMAHRESPSTNRFYLLPNVFAGAGIEYTDFRNRVISLTGIKR